MPWFLPWCASWQCLWFYQISWMHLCVSILGCHRGSCCSVLSRRIIWRLPGINWSGYMLTFVGLVLTPYLSELIAIFSMILNHFSCSNWYAGCTFMVVPSIPTTCHSSSHWSPPRPPWPQPPLSPRPPLSPLTLFTLPLFPLTPRPVLVCWNIWCVHVLLTGSSPICPQRSHSLVFIEKHLFYRRNGTNPQ